MIIISNVVLSDPSITVSGEDVISRLNLAWVKNLDEARSILKSITHPIFLDYPHGRSKPPKPNLSLSDAVALMVDIPNVKYFAISNVELYEDMRDLRKRLPEHVELVPKIETIRGVTNMPRIIEGAQTKTLMLDKEDLYNDVNADVTSFNAMIDLARIHAQNNSAHLLELKGVVFQ